MKYLVLTFALLFSFSIIAQDDYYGVDAIEFEMSLDYAYLSVGFDSYLPLIHKNKEKILLTHSIKSMHFPSLGLSYTGFDKRYMNISLSTGIIATTPGVALVDSSLYAYRVKQSVFRLNAQYIYYFSNHWGLYTGISYNYMIEKKSFQDLDLTQSDHYNLLSFRLGISGTLKSKINVVFMPHYEYFNKGHYLGLSVLMPIVPLD